MEVNTSFNYQGKLLVCFYTEPNFFSLSILENLLSKNCLVNIVTEDVKEWRRITSHLSKNLFGVTKQGEHFFGQPYNYAIYASGFIYKDFAYDNLKYFFSDPTVAGVKSLVILPLESFNLEKNNSIRINDNLGVVYVADLVGPRVNLESDLFLPRHISEILYDRWLTIEVGERFFPIFVYDAAKKISKWLLSFGPYGKEIFMLGSEISSTEFWKVNKRIIPELTINYDNADSLRSIPRGYETTYIKSDLPTALIETYKWVNKTLVEPEIYKAPAPEEKKKPKQEIKIKPPEKPKKVFPVIPKPTIKMPKVNMPKVSIPKVKKPIVKIKIRTNPKHVRIFRISAFILTIILLFPFLTGTLGAGLMYYSYKQFVSGNSGKVENPILISKTLFVVTKKYSGVFSHLPLIGWPYRELHFSSSVAEKVADMSVKAVPLAADASVIFDKILGDEIYDPSESLVRLREGLEYFYQNISLIHADTKVAVQNELLTARYLENKIDFERVKTIFSKGGDIVTNLPKIIGKDKRKSYLVLFQNNMELRPAGGFIGSYGIMNFDSGRMSELNVSDVYSADGQLKGHVEPPEPIKRHLGEANWWLRDSNWDPDFTTSALRAEWFLDKEVDQKVDGVIGIDLEVAKGLLKYTGEIFLPDYNLAINSENLYEKTQEEVEKDFFPGSRKKSSFLTALSRSLITKIEQIDSAQKVYILKGMFENLEERHIQLYLHDEPSQNAIKQIGWGGGIYMPDCGVDCYADFVGMAEANVGVNKANYFVEREVDLTLNVGDNFVERRLLLHIRNNANTALGPSGRYKNYVRLLIPAESEVLSVKSIAGVNSKEVYPDVTVVKDRKEVGLLMEVLGGQDETIEFVWRSVKNSSNKYGLYIRKQAGVGDDPWQINFIKPVGQVTSKPVFNLTEEGNYTYNTNLIRDFVSLFVWKND